MYHIGVAIVFIFYMAALILGTGFIIHMIASYKRDKYFLLKPWFFCKSWANCVEWECPYCFYHIKVNYKDKTPDNCPECGHKIRRENINDEY